MANDSLAALNDRVVFWLLGIDSPEADVVKWASFARNIILIFVLSAMGVWAILTYNSIASTVFVMEESLAAKGRAITRATARAAFVPLALRDKNGLNRVLESFEDEPDLIFLEIEEEGMIVARWAAPAGAARVMQLTAPIVPSAGYRDPDLPPGQPVALVRAGMSHRRIETKSRAMSQTNALESGLLLALVLAIGIFLIRGMTRRLWELVGEARMAEALRRSNQELEQFAYVASHDLQAPLRTVASYVQLLEQKYKGRLDTEADQLIASAIGGAKRLQGLIQDLLEYAHVGRTEAPKGPVSLDAVLDRVLASLQETIRDTHAVVERSLLPTVVANPLRMSQLLQNLIANSLKYRGSKEPLIRIRADRRGADWVISISDNGIGIDPKYFEKIFVIFQRLHTRMEYPGTGIGLALCKKIVEYHGG
ncbi:MAG: hypothetical protein HYZ74_07535, partial [Elusimicrobia bacterium]|nr:hypothetical protein [Elusimicrobiota bacterium]